MSSLMDPAAQRALVDRVREILLRPKAEWLVIDKEQADIASLYRSYVMPLAAIPPLASFLGAVLFGATAPFSTGRVSVGGALVNAILTYALSLVGVYVFAMIIDNLAPRYGGTRNLVQAFKVSAYSSTAQWVAGAFGILPVLSALTILGIYSLYLLYLGLPPLMKVAQERAMTYTVVSVVVAIVVSIVIGILTGIFAGLFTFATV